MQHFTEHQFPLIPPTKISTQKLKDSGVQPDSPRPHGAPLLKQRTRSINPRRGDQDQAALREKPGDHLTIDGFGPPAFSVDQKESKHLDNLPNPGEVLEDRIKARDSASTAPKQSVAQVSYLQLLKRLAADQLLM